MRRIRTCDLKLTGPKTIRPKKFEKITKKKDVRFFLKILKFLIFLEFFSENVLKTLLRGKESTRKKCRIVFEKFTFFDKNLKKSLKKKSCSKFFDKFKNFYFFRVFLRKCLKNSSRGQPSIKGGRILAKNKKMEGEKRAGAL